MAVEVSTSPPVGVGTRASSVLALTLRGVTYVAMRVKRRAMAIPSPVQVCGTCMGMREVHEGLSGTSRSPRITWAPVRGVGRMRAVTSSGASLGGGLGSTGATVEARRRGRWGG